MDNRISPISKYTVQYWEALSQGLPSHFSVFIRLFSPCTFFISVTDMRPSRFLFAIDGGADSCKPLAFLRIHVYLLQASDLDIGALKLLQLMALPQVRAVWGAGRIRTLGNPITSFRPEPHVS